MKDKILKPITFNTHKHHFHFLIGLLRQWQHLKWENVEKEIKVIGDNLLDLYLGNLSIEEICDECYQYLERIQIYDKAGFEKWLLPKQYKKIVLSDGSEWILKNGNNKLKYIHIHPGKYSPHSIRVKGTTLKTTLVVVYFAYQYQHLNQIDLKFVNLIRTKYLGISPVKSLYGNKGITRIPNLFTKHYLPRSLSAEELPEH